MDKKGLYRFSLKQWTLILGLMFLLLPALAYIWPEWMWGVHAWTFLEKSTSFGLWTLALIFIAIGYFSREGSWDSWEISQKNKLYLGIGLAIVGGVAFSAFPIIHDVYGDALIFLSKIGDEAVSISSAHYDLVKDLNIFRPDNGKNSLIALIQILSFHLLLDHITLFRIMDTLCGIGYFGLWTWFSFKYFTRPSTQWISLIIGLTSPLILNFFGHIEVYAPFFVFSLSHFMFLVLYLKERKKQWLIYGAIPLIISLKLHFSAFFFVPSFIFTLAIYFNWQQLRPTWRNALSLVILPLLVIGIIVYFYILKDYNDPRFLNDGIGVYERLFLPILSPEPPFDRYTLFHINHISDIFNMILLWSLPLIFLFSFILIFRRKQVNCHSSEIVILGQVMILLCSLFFMINPLAGMTLDWDLFMIPLVPFLIFVLVLLKQLEYKLTTDPILWVMISLSLFNLTFVVIHFDKDSLSHRYETIGLYSYKTNYLRSAVCLDNAMNMVKSDATAYSKRYEGIIEKLEPWALDSFDDNYSFLLMAYAKYLRTETRDFEKALFFHQKAKKYYNENPVNNLGLTEAYFLNNHFDEAYNLSLELIELGYPSLYQANRIATHAALEAKKYDEALIHARSGVDINPEDQLLQNITKRINENDRVDSLIYLFQRSQ